MNNREQIVQRAAEVITPALHLYYPVTIARGRGIYVESPDGKSYMDFSSGLAVLNVGHCHPRVVAAAERQLKEFIHTGGVYYNEVSLEAAQRLVAVTPAGLDMLFFSNSGAEAVEGALKLARYATGRQGIISFTGAFHGRTLGALSVTTSASRYRKRYHPLLPSVYHSPYPYCYRCPFAQTPQRCELDCLRHLESILVSTIPPEEVAAIIIEPVLGEGGYVPAPVRFLAGLRRLCDQHGILLVFDEVQSGLGRTGEWFAADHYGVTPDIMTVAKGIASGFPLSAVVAGKELMSRWAPGAHGTTFGGNPVSCAAALATIDVVAEEGLREKTAAAGARVMERLRELAGRHPVIGDLRGFGYMIGIEFVDGKGNPNGAACNKVLDFCLSQGLILINCAPERNVIRFIPPLNTAEEELEQALAIFAKALESLR
ncbi:MAG: aspartate aminotransferase family protein [Geobacteraceae bacterium]|nr:aspartate aminotransferase family protein [Geobacteraceae bacterium]